MKEVNNSGKLSRTEKNKKRNEIIESYTEELEKIEDIFDEDIEELLENEDFDNNILSSKKVDKDLYEDVGVRSMKKKNF